MDGLARWAELAGERHGDRLSWAATAHRRFMDELDPELRRAASSSLRPETDAALYGETQIGKTTLLLTLLGVHPDHMARVGRTLRAGRVEGRSATATATRYRPADGDGWTVRLGPDTVEHLDDDRTVERLADIRTAVESGTWPLETVVEVGIPRRYFAGAGGTHVRILDLPGIEAWNANENEHARRLIDTWVTHADVILLVALISKFGPLHPDQIGLDALRHWPRQLGKFRVVLTHTFSDETTSQWLDDTPPAGRTLHALRESIRPDLDNRRVIAGLDGHDLSWLYPLEFGKSWANLPDTDRSGARALRDGALAALRRDLELSIRPESRLRRAFQTRDIALDIHATRTADLDARVDRVRTRVGWLSDVARQQTGQVDRDVDDRRRLAAVLAAVDRLAPTRLVLDRSGLAVADDADVAGEIPRLRRLLVTAAGTALAAWQRTVHDELGPPCREAGRAVPPPMSAATVASALDAVARQEFAEVEQTVNAPLRGWLAQRFATPREAARRSVERACASAADAVEARLRTEVGSRLAEIRTGLERAVAARRQSERDARAALADTRAQVEAADREFARAGRHRAEEVLLMARHLAVAGHFPMHLEREYRNRQAELASAVESATDELSRLAGAVSIMETARAYDTIRYAE